MVTENQLQHHQRRYEDPRGSSGGALVIQQTSAAMDHQQQQAALQHAVAAGFASGNGLAVGMDLSGLVQSGLMSQLDQQTALNQQRKQREFIPDNKKDDSYWDRRRRNNEAAKRSREKRRLNDMVLESRVVELTKEVHILRAQLSAVRDKYGINPESLISIDQVLASLPSADQMLSLPRPRSRLLNGSLRSVSPSPSNRSLSPLPSNNNNNGGGVVLGSHGFQHVQQQRQSVLMSLGRQRSPSPYQGQSAQQASSYRFNESSASAGVHRHHQVGRQQQDRLLPPLPALTPVTQEDALMNGSSTTQDLHDKVNQYFDLCSSSSSSDGSHSPIDPAVAAGHILPLKLRHKQSHLGADVAATASAAAALLTLNKIKHEPGSPLMMMDNGRRSTESCSDERDSGVSSGDWANHSRSSSSRSQPETDLVMCNQPAKRMRMTPPDQQQSDENNGELRSTIARLASELESLKTLMLGSNNPAGQQQQSMNGSHSGRARNNNNNNYRLH